MAKVMENENYTIKKWSIYSRNSIGEMKSEEAFYNTVNEIKEKRVKYKWASVENINSHIKLVGVYENKLDCQH